MGYRQREVAARGSSAGTDGGRLLEAAMEDDLMGEDSMEEVMSWLSELETTEESEGRLLKKGKSKKGSKYRQSEVAARGSSAGTDGGRLLRGSMEDDLMGEDSMEEVMSWLSELETTEES